MAQTVATSSMNRNESIDDRRPVDVEYRNLGFKVTSREKEDGVFYILRNLNGTCRSGRLQAILGPSGAGKTSLLDVLAGNIYGGRVEGQILVNGIETTFKAMAKLSCYVMQHPVLLASATVKESLMTSALLRLSKSVPRTEKEKLVANIIEELGLTECANVLIGSEKDDIKGISGGQIRRLAIGLELVTRPQLIVLDEPTSGLDSEIALTIMLTLKSLAQKQRTVVCSIHQPNSDIVDTFDDFHLMAHGRSVYLGLWCDAVAFFAKVGFQCPTYKNPTDYFMAVLKERDYAEKITNQFEADRAVEQTENIQESSATKTNSTKALDNNGFVASDVPWWFQTYVLWIRFLRTWMRNPILFWSEFVQYVVTGVLVGLMYYNVGNDLNFGTSDRYASHFFILAAMMFVPSFAAVTLWDTERKLLKVESNRKSYSIFSYFLAKTGTTWPMEIFLSLALCLIVYWMIGYQTGFNKFVIFFLIVVMFQLISESLGLLCAFLTSKSQYAIVMLSLIALFIISFTGFVVRDIPVYFDWIQKIAYVSFATAGLAASEFDGIQLQHPNGSLIEGSALLRDEPYSDDDLLEATREDLAVLTNSLSAGENCWVMFGILMLLRFICFEALVISARLRFL